MFSNLKMSQEDDLLDHLLSAATEELENLSKSKNTLKETDIFNKENNLSETKLLSSSGTSVVHNGDTDSSDDEGNRNYENKKYNDCGRKIKQLLENDLRSSSYYDKKSSSWKIKAPSDSSNNLKSSLKSISKINETSNPKADVYTDPVFGMRIINPLISSTVLQERMVGREAVSFARISRHLQVYGKEKDWVIAGVIASKSVKTSQKGSQFCIWTLTDLKDDIKTVSLFLFSNAYKQLWKTAVGTVVGILNPSVLDKKDGSKDEACLSIDNSQKAMIFGQSKDFGTCRSLKKDGERCTSIVNLNRCEFCLYHIKQEYQKCSKRSELQANFAGRGLTALRNKVLGKNEVFYAGKSYMAIPAKKSKKMEQKDTSRLQSLNGIGISMVSNNITKAKNKNMAVRKQNASRLDVSYAQRLKDIELLKKLGGSSGIESKNTFTGIHSANITLEESKSNAVNTIANLKAKSTDMTLSKSKSNHYDFKSDLIVNVDCKKTFQGKISEDITLDKSKSTALEVIAKLKSKTPIPRLPSTSEDDNKELKSMFTNDNPVALNCDDLNLNCSGIGSDKVIGKSMLSDKEIVNDAGELTKSIPINDDLNTSLNESVSSQNIIDYKQVCKKFNEIGSKLLSRGFIQLEKRHAVIYKRVKSLLPRRESERRAHPLSRHCDILQAVETRISMLNMTYMKYIENSLLCFIPGKVLDEMKNVLALVESDQTPPRTHQLLQELRDLSSMAMEHFDENILPRVKEQVDKRSGEDRRSAFSYGAIASCSKSPKIIYAQHALSNELHKVKKQSKTHKHHISYLTQSTQKLCQKLRKQNIRLKAQSLKIREQERKIQEQNTKIQEQEATLADIKKHIDEWDQKYTDLTTELVRARDDILSATAHSPTNTSTQTSSPPKFYKTNIKPRMAHILPKSYMTLQFDLDRKRKSNLLPEIPLKRNRTPESDEKNQSNNQKKDDINLNIPDLIDFKNDKTKDGECVETKGSRFVRGDISSMISNSLESLLKSPLTSIKSRKRKMPDEIDLK